MLILPHFIIFCRFLTNIWKGFRHLTELTSSLLRFTSITALAYPKLILLYMFDLTTLQDVLIRLAMDAEIRFLYTLAVGYFPMLCFDFRALLLTLLTASWINLTGRWQGMQISVQLT